VQITSVLRDSHRGIVAAYSTIRRQTNSLSVKSWTG